MKSKVLISLLALASMFSLSACGLKEPVADSSKFLQESVYNLYNLQSFKYTASFVAGMNDVETNEKVTMDMNFNGAVSGQDKTKPGSEFTVVAKANDKTGDYRFDFSAKFFEKDIYLKLLALPSIPEFPVDGIKGLVGKWWKINASDLGGVDSVQSLNGLGVDYDKLDENGKKQRDLILTSKFFKEIEYGGNEALDGLNVYTYNFVVDGDGIYKYLSEVSKVDAQTKDADLQDLKAMLTNNVFNGTAWVDSLSKTMVKMEIVLDAKKSKGGEFDSLNFGLNLSDLNKPFNVEIPTDFEIFDLGKFLGSFLGGGAAPAAVVPAQMNVPAFAN